MHAFHNHVQLVGRCGPAPELTLLTDGTPLVRFRLYQNPRSGSSADEPPVCFCLKAWNGVGRAVHRQVRRGDRLLIQGKLVNRVRHQQGRTLIQSEVHVAYFSVLANRMPADDGEGFSGLNLETR